MSDGDMSPLYLDAAARASRRSRDILFIMLIPTALTFSGFWNTRPDAWVALRVRRLTEIVRLLRTQPQNVTNNGYSLGEAEVQLGNLRKTQSEAATVHMPILNSAVDVNDIGLFSGIVLLTLMLWFRVALWQECNAVRNAFAEARRHSALKLCYDVLTAQQFLSRAVSLNEAPRDAPPFNPMRLFVGTPLLIFTAVVWRDVRTSTILHRYGLDGAAIVLQTTLSALCLFGLLFITIRCFGLLRRLDNEWRAAAADALIIVAQRAKEAEAADAITPETVT
jgi:hypothetical protein